MAIPIHLHEVCNQALAFAVSQLEKNGSFYPFASILSLNGEIKRIATPHEKENPSPQEIYRELESSLQSITSNEDVQAVTLASDVNVPSALGATYPDGIRIVLETETLSIWIYVPYRLVKTYVVGAGKKFDGSRPIEVHDVKRSFFKRIAK